MKRSKFLKKTISAFLVISLIIPPIGCSNNANAQAGPDPSPTPPNAKTIKMALLLDTSNSMDGLIDQAKAQLWNVVNELAMAKCDGVAPKLQIALYQYGNDQLAASEGYIQMVRPLTTDLDAISQSLFALTTNGGSEFCGHVINTSLNQLDWDNDNDDYKVIFIAGNEPFNQGNVSYQGVCSLAKEKGIIVNTIHCGDFQTGIGQFWKNGADLTGGEYMAINQNSKTVYISSPYDDKISALNDSLNKTYISYGSQGWQYRSNMTQQDINANGVNRVNKVGRTISKSSAAYENSHWDLVDASKDKKFKLDSVDVKTLPKEMQSMNTKERKDFIADNGKKRVKFQNEIQELAKKRREFVAKERKKAEVENQLGIVIIKAVREQAQKHDFTFTES